MENEAQKKLFERLIRETDFKRDDVFHYTDNSERTAYRITHGQSAFTLDIARQLMIEHPDPHVGDMLADYFTQGSKRIIIQIPDAPGQVDKDALEALDQLTAILKQRREHLADGMIDPDERDAEIDQARAFVRVAEVYLHQVMHQKTTARHKARKPKVNGVTTSSN